MKALIRKLREMTLEEVNSLVTVLLASMLGTMGSGTFLTWALASSSSGVMERFLISLAATLLYGIIIAGTFYLLLPKSRLAFKKLWIRRKLVYAFLTLVCIKAVG